jgi:sialic acid synthase SpsE
MDVAALALGANLIEKSITEDRTTRSIEHIFSLEPQDMTDFIRTIREVEIAMGTSRRILHDEEREKRKVGRRSVSARKDLRAGHVLSEEDLDYRRPGYGIPPNEVDRLIGKKLRTGKKAGEAFAWTDLEA